MALVKSAVTLVRSHFQSHVANVVDVARSWITHVRIAVAVVNKFALALSMRVFLRVSVMVRVFV